MLTLYFRSSAEIGLQYYNKIVEVCPAQFLSTDWFAYLLISFYAMVARHYEAWCYESQEEDKTAHRKERIQRKKVSVDYKLKTYAFGEVRGKHYTIKEFQRLAGREKKLLVQRSLQLVGMVAENSCNVLE